LGRSVLIARVPRLSQMLTTGDSEALLLNIVASFAAGAAPDRIQQIFIVKGLRKEVLRACFDRSH